MKILKDNFQLTVFINSSSALKCREIVSNSSSIIQSRLATTTKSHKMLPLPVQKFHCLCIQTHCSNNSFTVPSQHNPIQSKQIEMPLGLMTLSVLTFKLEVKQLYELSLDHNQQYTLFSACSCLFRTTICMWPIYVSNQHFFSLFLPKEVSFRTDQQEYDLKKNSIQNNYCYVGHLSPLSHNFGINLF